MKHSAFYNPVWHTPVLPPIPQAVLDCHKPSLSLADRANRDWQFLFEEIANIPSPFSKKQDYDFQNIPSEKWQPVTVPGELVMQGFDIENNREYYYRKTVTVPSDFPKGRLYIRLEGVYCNARVWVNGKFVRFHIGGFTPWDCDITDYIDQNKFELVVGVADIEGKTPGIWNPQNEYLSDASWASYYAHHNIGGILRGITLFVLPESRILRTYLNTELTDNYRRAKLHANLQIDAARADLQLEVQLQKDGKTVCSANETGVPAGSNDFRTRRNNIRSYRVGLSDGTLLHLRAKSPEIWAYTCRYENVPNTLLLVGAGQFYPGIQWGNAFGSPAILQQFSFEMQLAKQNLTAKAEND